MATTQRPNRVHAGIPTGGQFATDPHPEAELVLEDPAPEVPTPLRNQHGPVINPSDPELVRQLGSALAPHGGESFVTPDVADDADTNRLVVSGHIWPQKVVRAKAAEHNACHEVAADIHSQDPSRFTHIYGYALTADDGMWRSHSWVHDRRTDQLIEPTPSSRAKYFGVALSDPNRSHEPPEPGPMSSNSPEVQAGKVYDRVVVESDGYSTTFHRRREDVFAEWPYAMRFQANRPLTDDEAVHFAGLVGYAYRSTIAGEPIGMGERDTPYSLVVSSDMTKTRRDDLGMALEEFEDTLPVVVRDGSPVRKTDRAGAGTKGTRLIEGMGKDLRFEIYYDQATGHPASWSLKDGVAA
jgi:hypothetical protein